MAIQRNALVAPFSNTTPILEKGAKGPNGKPTSTLAFAHQKWFLSAQTAINASPQIAETVPTSSSAAGQPGSIAFDSNWFYVCVGLNEWRRASLNTF